MMRSQVSSRRVIGMSSALISAICAPLTSDEIGIGGIAATRSLTNHESRARRSIHRVAWGGVSCVWWGGVR